MIYFHTEEKLTHMNSKHLQFIRRLVAAVLIIPILVIITGNKVKDANVSVKDYLNSNHPVNANDLFESMQLACTGISRDAFFKAWQGYYQLTQSNRDVKTGLITIIDFSQPSNKERLFVIDINNRKLLFTSLVAHGRNSGLVYARSFSNKPETYKSSLGFYKTLNTYEGENGFSLRLEGLEKNINDKVYERSIVMHGADYVSKEIAKAKGYIGRSYGCPAIPHDIACDIIKTIQNGSLLFIYHPSKKYEKQSSLI
jgi:hypothetical protein